MRPWNAAGTLVNKGPVTALGRVNVRRRAAPVTSVWVQGIVNEGESRLAQQADPERKLRDPGRILCFLSKDTAPSDGTTCHAAAAPATGPPQLLPRQ